MKSIMLFGTFDILHIGHIKLFQQAKKYASKLIVVVARDINVEKIKKRKPLFTDRERKKLLETVNLIDQVFLGDKIDPYKIIKKVKPDIIALGYDQKEYVKNLDDFLKDNELSVRVIRLKSYKSNKYKSHKIRQEIDKCI